MRCRWDGFVVSFGGRCFFSMSLVCLCVSSLCKLFVMETVCCCLWTQHWWINFNGTNGSEIWVLYRHLNLLGAWAATPVRNGCCLSLINAIGKAKKWFLRLKFKGLNKAYSANISCLLYFFFFFILFFLIEGKNAFEAFVWIKDWKRAQNRRDGIKLLEFLFLKCDRVSLKGIRSKWSCCLERN